MASLNQCSFIGNVGRDPEMRYFPSGDAYCNISIATKETWKDKQTGEKKEKTEWIPLTFTGKLAEIVGQYVKKGSEIWVQGKFETRKYTDKDGVEKYQTSIKCDQMQMIGGRPAGADGSNQQRQAPAAAPAQRQAAAAPARRAADPADDDIPF